jgi:hypothetical protein
MRRVKLKRMRAVVLSAAIGAASASVALAVASSALAGSPWWGLTSGSWPSNLPPGGIGKIIVTAENRGNADVSGVANPVVVTDALPPSLDIKAIEGIAGEKSGTSRSRGALKCAIVSTHKGTCSFEGPVLLPFEQLEVRVTVEVREGASSEEQNTMSVTGGGASGKSLARAINIGEEASFGIEDFEVASEEEGGVPSTQAGKHPFQLTDVLMFNTSNIAPSADQQEPAAMTKDVSVELPPGVVGNPTAVAQCTDAQFTKQEAGAPAEVPHNECPAASAVGVASVTYNTGVNGMRFDTTTTPVFNLPPAVGEPARFGFEVLGVQAYIDTSVRTGGDYGVTATVNNITEIAGFFGSKVTLWGVPGAAAHDGQRGWACLLGQSECTPSGQSKPEPFFSLPTACTGPLRATAQTDSWAEPKPARPFQAPLFAESLMIGMDGCNHLQFNPEIGVAPDVPDGSTATGLGVLVHVPQTAALNSEGLAESALKDTTVRLPVGVAVNPGGADGLQACSEGQIGFLGKEAGEPATNLFTPVGIFCPDASKVGTVEIETPLLPHTLKGAVYLATPAPFEEPGLNPFGSLVAMYLVAEDPVSGTLLKLSGEVHLEEGTGQLVTTFKNSPQLPFENLRLHFFGESRAPLGTPGFCGSYETLASFAPWSGAPASRVGSMFDITSGPNGAPCKDPLPFAPSFTGGATNIQAAAFSPFTTTLGREDGNQDIQAVQLHMPPGLLGLVSRVRLCGEAQANAGTCDPESLIGHTTVSVGLGSNPYTVVGGEVFLTGPYRGAPYGLSIVNPANAGPFDLGKVVVRARVEVDRLTTALTVTTDETGPYAIPPMLKGIPLQIRHINVTVDKPGFTLNPTNCEKLRMIGTLTSVQGTNSTIVVPFQATNCATLAFKPRFKVSTPSRTSRSKGAGLDVKLSYQSGSFGKDANIARVKVNLPKQLPSRLTTLQKACPDHVFNQNPADCPAASHVGQATTTTPILASALTGPAYFVSHGVAKFPELIVVLQGDGVTVDLHGETFINKQGITSSTFRTVPDVPVNTFELKLPQGTNSALAANGNLCSSKLTMPTAFTAQNGMTIHQSTKVTVTGCSRHVRHERKKIHRRKK